MCAPWTSFNTLSPPLFSHRQPVGCVNHPHTTYRLGKLHDPRITSTVYVSRVGHDEAKEEQQVHSEASPGPALAEGAAWPGEAHPRNPPTCATSLDLAQGAAQPADVRHKP